MPYYMRLTADGVGLHARYVRGRHESHGCIGIFYNDAEWLNRTYAAQVPVHVRVERYGETIYTI